MAKGDNELIEFIHDCLESFCDYHRVIYDMETKLMLYNSKDMEREEWQSFYSKMDVDRRSKHNLVILSVRMLNRLAEKEGIPPLYDGIISDERPYRREIANSVLAYIETIIKERR